MDGTGFNQKRKENVGKGRKVGREYEREEKVDTVLAKKISFSEMRLLFWTPQNSKIGLFFVEEYK